MISSSFGAAARAAILGFSTIALPLAAQDVRHCEKLAGIDVEKESDSSAALAKLSKALTDYKGWPELQRRLVHNASLPAALCVAPYRTSDPVVVRRHNDGRLTLDINNYQETGRSLLSDGRTVTEGHIRDKADIEKIVTDSFAAHAVFHLSYYGLAPHGREGVSTRYTPEDTALLLSLRYAQAVAEQALFAVDLFERTGRREALDLTQNEFGRLSSILNDLPEWHYPSTNEFRPDPLPVLTRDESAFRAAVMRRILTMPEARHSFFHEDILPKMQKMAAEGKDLRVHFNASLDDGALEKFMTLCGPRAALPSLSEIRSLQKRWTENPETDPAAEALHLIRQIKPRPPPATTPADLVFLKSQP